MRNLIFLSLVLVTLTGCRTFWDPTFMPAGYTYHANEYKSPPGPEAKSIGYPYSPEKNEAVLLAWKGAIADLVDSLEKQENLSPQNIFVESPGTNNALLNSFDHVLREEFRARGYTLLSSPDQSLHVIYHAFSPVEGVENTNALKGHTRGDITLNLVAGKNGQALGYVSKTYDLPLYGYSAIASKQKELQEAMNNGNPAGDSTQPVSITPPSPQGNTR